MIQREESLGPREVTSDNVMFWSRHSRELEGNIANKAHQFLVHNCIQYIGFDSVFGSKYTFICLPLSMEATFEYNQRIFEKIPFGRAYNSSEYLVYKEKERWICNCQGWRTAERDPQRKKSDGIQCSHGVALMFAFKCKRFNQAHGATDKDMEPDF